MRVAIIATDYYPIRSSAAIQLECLAIALKKKGSEPVILTPSGGLFYSNSDIHNGIPIIRLPSFPVKDVNYIARTFGELMMPITMGIGLMLSPVISIKGFTGIICYSPSIFFGLLVHLIKHVNQCKSYLILRDIFPQWALDLGLLKNGIAFKFFKFFSLLQYKSSDVIGVQSESNLRFVSNISTSRIEVLNNWIDDLPLKKSCSIDFDNKIISEKKIFIYAGNMGIAQNPDSIISLATCFESLNDFGFLLVGRGSEVKNLKSRIDLLKLQNVMLHHEIEASEINDLYGKCYVGLISLDLRHTTHNIPGKFLTYMKSGLPVLACTSLDSDLASLILKENVGYVVESFVNIDIEKIVKFFSCKENYAFMVNNARRISNSLFNVDKSANQILNAIY